MTQITSGQQTYSATVTQGRVFHNRVRTARMPKPKERQNEDVGPAPEDLTHLLGQPPVGAAQADHACAECNVDRVSVVPAREKPSQPPLTGSSAVSIVVSPSTTAKVVKTTIVREQSETSFHDVSCSPQDLFSPDTVSNTVPLKDFAPESVPDSVPVEDLAPNSISDMVPEQSGLLDSVLPMLPQPPVLPITVSNHLENTLVSPVVPLIDTVIEQTEALLKELDGDLPVQPMQEAGQQAFLARLNDISNRCSRVAIDPADRFDTEFGGESESPGGYRLGQLLVELGLITPELLEHSLHLSVDLSISLGRVLIMSGSITGKQLQWAIQVQALLNNGLITPASAARIADLMTCSGMTFQRALNCAGYPNALPGLEVRATRIGDLLVEAGLVCSDDFDSALGKAQSLGLPVGRFLLTSGLVPEALLETVVNAQRFVREGKFSREEAISAIQAAAERQRETCGQSDGYSDIPLRSMRLGELLTVAGIVTDAHIDHAVEFGLRCNVPVGQVLTELEIVSESTLDSALTLQGLVARGSLEPIDAAYALIDVHHHGMTLAQALKRNRPVSGQRNCLSFEQFLASLELISLSQIEEAIETARRSPLFVGKALVFSGAVADETVQVALKCHFYVRESMLKAEEASFLFNICHRTGLPVEDGMKELGLTVRPAASTSV